VIKTKRTPSAASKHKETSLGSTDNSLEAPSTSKQNPKNATDSPQLILNSCRGKSYTKNQATCRIVNSKKLPFDIRPSNNRKMKWKMEEV
jgi:hypothetical protein